MDMSDLGQLMQARFRRLLLDFEMTYSAEQVSHPGERGRLLEETLKTFLSAVLPNRIGVGSGQIVEALKQEPSKQVDVVLYDALNYPLLLNEGSFQLFPNEAVLAVIEVKSTLNRQHLKQGVENIASSKSLRKFPLDTHPDTLGVLFCYKTSWKRPRTVFRNLSERVKDSQGHAPDLICSLEPAFLLVATNPLGESVARLNTLFAGSEKESEFPSDQFVLIRPLEFSKERILLLFYLVLIDYLNRTLNIGVNMAQHVKSSTAWRTDVINLENS
ncbi:MAG TPA: hypothetical protein ENI39_03560 [Anaerolineae bacterium]|nr:hypothetical protein [Anaerolineae bacterium]